MIKSCQLLLNLVNSNNFRAVRSISSQIKQEKWDLYTAVCLERKPIITPLLSDLETKFKNYLSEVELENSLKSDHEAQHEKDLKQLEILKKGDNADLDIQLNQTAQDLLDMYTEEYSRFKFASRTTDADKKNNLKSLNRRLDKHLVLVVNQKIGQKKYYILPQSLRKDGETLRQTANRILTEFCGNDLKAQIYGNAPFGFYKYKYPKKIQETKEGAVGAKIFIYFARYQKGQLPDKGLDYRWLDRKELATLLPSAYGNSVSQMLIDE